MIEQQLYGKQHIKEEPQKFKQRGKERQLLRERNFIVFCILEAPMVCSTFVDCIYHKQGVSKRACIDLRECLRKSKISFDGVFIFTYIHIISKN